MAMGRVDEAAAVLHVSELAGGVGLLRAGDLGRCFSCPSTRAVSAAGNRASSATAASVAPQHLDAGRAARAAVIAAIAGRLVDAVRE